MKITSDTTATLIYTTEYFFTLNQEEAQALFDITGNVGGSPDDGQGNLLPRGHISNIRNIMRDKLGFEKVHETRSSMYFTNESNP